ncbi:hypothetical protein FQN53_000906 [Emmonsiellopsis sp. PD_33]|nr:hypothetical protein FQN53_000906 [Emmonsiellopsis sp. PD_33]
MSLASKTAIVTGASRGIGRAIALHLASLGANIVVNYQSSSAAADEVVKSIEASGTGVSALAVKADVSYVSQGKELVEKTVERFGKVDILVLNAGLLVAGNSLEKTEEADYDRAFGTNVKGVMFLVKSALPHVPSGGRILFFSTSLTAASTITPNYFLYAATKGAVEQMSRVLAKEVAPRGITVNTISPGPIGTESFYDGKSEAVVDMIAKWNPAGRIGRPEEVARVVGWISGEESSWVNGQNIRINGGMTVG